MPAYKNTDKIISHLNDEIEACGNPDSDNEPIVYGTKLGLLSAKAFIETAETADVQEVRHGRWKYSNDGAAFCTSCKTKTDPRNYGYPYCNMCGARMDGKE